MFRNQLIFLVIFLPLLLSGQLHDVRQKKLLKNLSIQKIEKIEKSIDSLGNEVGSSTIIELINNAGHIIEQRIIDPHNELTIKNDFVYLNDTLLLESHNRQLKHPAGLTNSIKYLYNKDHSIDKCWFLSGGKVNSELKYSYSKNGRIKKIKQKIHGDSELKSFDGRTDRKYKYNSIGKVKSIEIKSKIGKTYSKELYWYEYDNEGNLVNTFLEEGNKNRKTSY